MSRHHLTWEYLFGALSASIQALQTTDNDANLIYGHKRQWDAVLGLYDLLPSLHTHPRLRQYIPYMGVHTFHWWPTEHYLITLDTWEGRDKYRLILHHHEEVEAEVMVPIDQVIDTLVAFIQQAEQNASSV